MYKVCSLVECLGYSAFLLVFYIAYDIILICLTGDCFIYKLKLRDPFKSHEIASSGFLHIHQCNVDKIFVFQTPDILGLRWEYVWSVDSSRKMTFTNLNTISNPLGVF